MNFATKQPGAILAAALTLCCGLAAAQTTAPSTSSTGAQSNPTPASQSTPTPSSQSNATPASQANPTPASQPNPAPASQPNPTPATASNPTTSSPANTTPNANEPNARNMDRPVPQQQIPATQRNNNEIGPTGGGSQQNAAAMRCASLTGIAKAECERRDSPDIDLPAGRTQGQMQRELQRQAEADRANPPAEVKR